MGWFVGGMCSAPSLSLIYSRVFFNMSFEAASALVVTAAFLVKMITCAVEWSVSYNVHLQCSGGFSPGGVLLV